MQPIVLKYANAEGYTDFVYGIPPDHLVYESLRYAEPFGSLNDPMLARALEDITGVSPAKKAAFAPEFDKKLKIPRKPLPEIKGDLYLKLKQLEDK
jgi:hypothetical protein